MAGSSATSTLDIVLKDDVSKSASQVAASLERLAAKEKAVSEALAQSGLRNRFGDQLKAVGAGVTHVQAASAAWAKFARAQELAADSTTWTTRQTAAVRNWENVTKAAIRSVMGEERAMARSAEAAAAAFAKSQARAAEAAEHAAQRVKHAHRNGGHFDTSTLGGTVATAGAFAFEHAMHSVIERYRDFDKERRYAKVVMGLTDEQQEPLVKQALTGGATSRFNDIQWLEAQREFAARGYNLDQVKAFTPIAADVGTSFDKTLPEAVKAIEGAMLGFGKDVSTYERAVAAARQTADFEVKASKISGMSFDDMTQLYKYGAAPAKMAGLSEAHMLAFGAVLKKNNMGGDEAGTAFRALAKNLITPTAGARTAMRANGIDFSAYQHVRDAPIDVAGFAGMVAQRYGVELNEAARAGLTRIFTDKALVGDASRFTPAVVQLLRSTLGGDDAKSLKSISGLANEYRTASVDGVDTVRLLTDMMGAMAKNKGLANAIFGSKQGGRIFAALSDPEVFEGLLEKIRDHSAGFSGNVAAARNEGFNGQMGQLEGAIATLESSIGRAFDGGGRGGPLTEAATAAARFVQALSELNPAALRAGVEAAAAAAVLAGLKSIDFIRGGFGLKEAGGEMIRAGDVQLRAGQLMLEAAGLHPPGGGKPGGGSGGGRPGEPGGPHAEPDARSAEPGAKGPAEPGAKPDAAGERPPPAERRGIYSEKPPIPEAAPKGGTFLKGGGIKGLAGGLAEGVVGGLLYAAGEDAIHAFEDTWMGFTAGDRKKIDDVTSRATLSAITERLFGRIGDDTSGPDPYRSGARPAIDERARRSAEAFEREPEAERGRRRMTHDAEPQPPPEPYVDAETRRDRVEARQAAAPSPAAPEQPRYADPEDRRDRVEARRPPAPPPAAAPPPADHALDGFVVGAITPKVDTSEIDAAHAKATEAGAALQTALNVTAMPKVETGSIEAANAAVQRLLASLAAIGPASAAAHAAVASIGGAGARPAGPSLASRGRGQFPGNASSFG